MVHLALATCAAAIPLGSAVAATQPLSELHHEHADVAVRINPQLTLQQVVDAAAKVFPGQASLRAGEAQAQVHKDKSKSWQSAPGAITFDHLQSRAEGLTSTETMLGYQWSLWRWGERSAQSTYAQALDTQAAEYRVVWNWQRKQQIHDAYAQLQLTAADEHGAEQKLEVLQGVAKRVRQRVNAGGLAARENDRVRVLLLGAQSDLIDAKAMHYEASRHWVQITGGDEQPAQWDADLIKPVSVEPDDSLSEHHPLLRAARAAMQAASGKLQALQARGSGSPLLFVGARQDRVTGEVDRGAGYVSLTIPLGGAVHARAQQADLTVAAAQAEDNLRQAQLQAQWEIHEAFHELDVQRQQWEQSRERVELAKGTLEKSLRAFDLGEISLLEVSVDEQANLDATRAHNLATVSLQRARARVNSLLGES